MRNSLALDDMKQLQRLESSPSDIKNTSSEDGNYNNSLEEEDQFEMAAQPQTLRIRTGDLSPPPRK